MKQTRNIMGMPIVVEIVDSEAKTEYFDEVFSYFTYVDEKFSTYKASSEISMINSGKIKMEDASHDMQEIFRLAEETKQLSDGYFDISRPDGICDPSGIVKGWAIWNASKILRSRGINNFYVEAGGDIEVSGLNEEGTLWSVGIENPFQQEKAESSDGKKEIVKTVYLTNKGIATSGVYKRGSHIYNPLTRNSPEDDIISLTVIGPNVYEADRFATAGYAMGKKGIEFIGRLEGFDGYQIDGAGMAIMTETFNKYTV